MLLPIACAILSIPVHPGIHPRLGPDPLWSAMAASDLAPDRQPEARVGVGDGDENNAQEAPAPGSIAFLAASGATVQIQQEDDRGNVVTVLQRGTQVAARVPSRLRADQAQWDLQLVAKLARHSLRGTVLVTIYDADDAQAIAKRQVTALWSFTLPPTQDLSVRVRIDDDAGFRPQHNYLFRVVQLVRKRERVLATGTLRLE